jgi:RNA-splicing ligase RtcB
VRVTAEDRELLLIEWLEELVYLLDADQLPDRQLCCAPLRSSEGRTYLAAMAAAAG